MCLCVRAYAHVSVGATEALELELEVVVSCLKWLESAGTQTSVLWKSGICLTTKLSLQPAPPSAFFFFLYKPYIVALRTLRRGNRCSRPILGYIGNKQSPKSQEETRRESRGDETYLGNLGRLRSLRERFSLNCSSYR